MDAHAFHECCFSYLFPLCFGNLVHLLSEGDLQNTLLAMRDCACEASVALSAFGNITRGHTALTSECGSMLEEVWCFGTI